MTTKITRKEETDESGRIWDHWVKEDGTESGSPSPQFRKGEWLWYIVRDRFLPLLVKVQIEEVEDHFRKNSDSAYLFYAIDEPVGHSVNDDELFMLDTESTAALDCFADTVQDEWNEPTVNRNADLKDYRTGVQEFIAGTWGGDHPGFDPLPEKKLGVDYFNADSVLDAEGHPTEEGYKKLKAASEAVTE